MTELDLMKQVIESLKSTALTCAEVTLKSSAPELCGMLIVVAQLNVDIACSLQEVVDAVEPSVAARSH